MLKKIALLTLAIMVTACVSPVSLDEQSVAPEYQTKESILISVIDQRQRVIEGKKKTFVGKAHASFGIPVDWHVKQVLATEPGDKEKNLAQFLQSRLVYGLNTSGWNAAEVDLDEIPEETTIKQLMEEKNATKMINLVLNEWYFSINLNWVSAFNFDTDTSVLVYDLEDGQLLTKNLKERDVIEEKANQSPQNNILLAYKAQLDQIINDEEVRGVMSFD
ncbi:hypothetical protein [Microbulbifer variabilis]|uniref:hypothetical protein n=1 Tax=Microbulbifer variabilis TaxID=266805 RepID=UPI001CFE033D|nr:hypothetical protein [Microbulbifer variabilis]